MAVCTLRATNTAKLELSIRGMLVPK
jgi:hypothetical protein